MLVEEGLEGCRKSEEAGEEVEGVAEVEDLVVPGTAEEAPEDAGAAEVVDLAVPGSQRVAETCEGAPL